MSEQHAHIVPIRTYAITLLFLFVGMILTIGAYKLHITDNSYINNAVAMSIAIVKAALVVGIFMGVKWGTNLIKMWAYAGFVWFLLMFVVYCDYMTRSWEPVSGWEKDTSALPRLPYVAPKEDRALLKED